MKIFSAILMMVLIGLTSVSLSQAVSAICCDLITDTDDRELENKDGQNELKEFTILIQKRSYPVGRFIIHDIISDAFFFPQPIIERHIPPPNPASVC